MYLQQQLKRIELADAVQLAGVSTSAFKKHIYGQRPSTLLEGFPAPCHRGRKLLWVTQDVLDWLAGQRTFLSISQKDQDQKDRNKESALSENRKPGRPKSALSNLASKVGG